MLIYYYNIVCVYIYIYIYISVSYTHLDVYKRQVPSHIFDSVSELRELKLSGNPIQRLSNEAFANIPQLVRLEISDCRLGTIEPVSYTHLDVYKRQ